MQDPTDIIKALVDHLEHADDVLTDPNFSGFDCEIPEDPEGRDRKAALARAKSWLTAQGNADLFAPAQEPTA